jgi:flagellar basal body-associated protein FliL
MTEEADKKESSDQEQVTASSSASGKKSLFVFVAVFLLIVGVGAPVGYFLLQEPPLEIEEEISEVDIAPVEEAKLQAEVEQSSHEVELEEGEELLGAIVPLDAFLVNLSGGKYIRLQVQAELETPETPSRFYSRVVPMRDQIITLLTQKTAGELEDSAGKEKLKTSIREIMNQQLRREDVRRIYFTQFVIQ